MSKTVRPIHAHVDDVIRIIWRNALGERLEEERTAPSADQFPVRLPDGTRVMPARTAER